MARYTNRVVWKGDRKGYTYCENGTEMDFCAPPSLHGYPDRMTPEDAYMMSVNTCVHMMVVWAAERFRLDLVSFECTAVGEVEEHIDKTSWFKTIVLKPRVTVRGAREAVVLRALEMAYKYSTIAQSLKSEIVIEPEVTIIR
ncbi:MAG: OsmC family protein [Syntrophorhabdaceae bacterium]|nr:OsmC family protein [Syntrophorhabdaceae bacterium]MDD4197128.1 OsmC family protein [Syntrophorhabdaceae bacterium]